ncbi:MAG: PIG-L family deacetylase, partial [Myxococcota bacterium]
LRDLHHLRVVGSVLYVGAHPDDENTELIGWLEGQGIRAAYLSMTRGDGGQNLIGAEQDELLGVLRTGELLAARSVDGGEQWFTRVRDFGFSKSSDETLRLWGHDEALEDVVRAIRTFRPDAIVTRFPPTGETHGHHLASAILAAEAFEKAADPAYVTDGLGPWRADRIVHNTTTWSLPDDADTSGWATIDIGTWDPLLGLSYGEVAAIARTNHKSQGFGSEPEVGPSAEYFEGIAGTPIVGGRSPLDGLPLDWGRFPEAAPFDRAVRAAERRFDPDAPDAVLPLLAKAHARLDTIPDPTWRAEKTRALDRLMADCAGLWLTARATAPAVTPGGTATVTLTALVRAPSAAVTLSTAAIGGTTTAGGPLAPGVPWTRELAAPIAADTVFSRPHWLVEPWTRTRYAVTEPALRVTAEAPPSLVARFSTTIAGATVALDVPVEFAVTDPVNGERRRTVEVLPPVTATFDQPARIVPPGVPATSRITLRASAGAASGTLRLTAPTGITADPAEVAFALADGGERVVEVRLSAAPGATGGALVATTDVGGASASLQRLELDHLHVPQRTVLVPASQALVAGAVARGGVDRVGYVVGSGDTVPDGLRSMGYQVEELTEAALATGDLDGYDAIVVGIRAFNTHPHLLALHDRLMGYVAAGGHLVVQYNTNNRFDPLTGELGPAPFAIGRGRVTEEDAAMTPVDPSDPALTTPNALGPDDFDGWVQERGLYFAETWDPAYRPVFSTHDTGGEPLLGSTLVAHHGEGVFVYTGLAFFRQLPAGVPGAYRLLANLLALE